MKVGIEGRLNRKRGRIEGCIEGEERRILPEIE
jgi:hypothetical protein